MSSKKISPRTRLSKDSIATIKSAETACVKRATGGFEVEVQNGNASHILQSGDGNAKYAKITAAKQAVRRHNKNVRFPQQPGVPAPGFEEPLKTSDS